MRTSPQFLLPVLISFTVGHVAIAQPSISHAAADSVVQGHRSSYYKDGQIHVNVPGTPEKEPLTKGHWDFKPSWSKTDDRLVFFRRLISDKDVSKWKTAICIINVDGTGFHQLTDGTHTDFNQTWTRDGTNTPIWNRKHPQKNTYQVIAGKIGGKPGEEIALTGNSYHAWSFTCLIDGRILVGSTPPKRKRGYYLMTPNPGGDPKFERVQCDLDKTGVLARISLSPDETKVCFEYQTGFVHSMPGRTLYIADFDATKRTMTNFKPFANEERKNSGSRIPAGQETPARSSITREVSCTSTNWRTDPRAKFPLTTRPTTAIPMVKRRQSDQTLNTLQHKRFQLSTRIVRRP